MADTARTAQSEIQVFQADRSRLGSQIAAHLRDQIMSGQLAPGEKLRLLPLSSTLNVSTSPVREALLLLESEGLVKSEPHRGFVVEQLSARDILDIFELHAFVAGKLAERGCPNMSERQLTDLASVNAEIQEAAAVGRGADVEELNYQFHRIINRAGESPILARILRQTTHYVPRHYYGKINGWIEATLRDHGPIIDALRRRDACTVRDLTEELSLIHI